jgi:hypothetical protein
VAFTGPRRGSLSVDAGLDRERRRCRSVPSSARARAAARSESKEGSWVLREHIYMIYLSNILTHGPPTTHVMLIGRVSGHTITQRTHMLLHGQTDR